MNFKQTLFLTIALLSTIVFVNCTQRSEDSGPSQEVFSKTLFTAESFKVNGSRDTIIEGENGTVLVIPKGSFRDQNGNIVDGSITIELNEMLTIDDMLMAGVTTDEDDKLLQPEAMIYLGVTSSGETLDINEDKPIYVEIPTDRKKSGIRAYKGIQDAQGGIKWMNPKEIEKFLVTVDNNLLNFLPPGFETEVDKGMPYRNYTVPTKALKDSLYYSLSVSDGSELLKGLVATDYNEPYYHRHSKVIQGKYTHESYKHTLEYPTDTSNFEEFSCGIDPAIIKVIREHTFHNTFLSTREFEARLQVLFRVCDNKLLESYIRSLDTDLWLIDSLTAETLGTGPHAKAFWDFSRQHLTNVRNAGKYAKLLEGYYNRHLSKVQSDLEAAKEKVLKELQQKNKVAESMASEYKDLLWKREKYRMETYGFEWSETGWIGIGRTVFIKEGPPILMQITVEDGDEYDRVHAYMVFKSIKSIYRLNTENNINFYGGDRVNRQLLVPADTTGTIVCIAYNQDTPYLASENFHTSKNQKIDLDPYRTTLEQMRKDLSSLNNYRLENKIEKDLEYIVNFAKEKKRQRKLKTEAEFIQRLWRKANPCCASEKDSIFETLDNP